MSAAPTDSRAGSTLANIAIARTLKPAIPVLDTPIKKAARHTSAHCQPVREINTYPNFMPQSPADKSEPGFSTRSNTEGVTPQAATTNASAIPPSCARLSAHCVSPRSSAIVWALPCSLTAGQPFSTRRTSISCHATAPIPVPSALATASLAAHAPPATRAAATIGQFPRREHRVVNRSPYRSTSPAIRRTSTRSAPTAACRLLTPVP